ncbi:MAG: hypothetical protein ACRD96_12220 [Bryobacteraceae bacterium]
MIRNAALFLTIVSGVAQAQTKLDAERQVAPTTVTVAGKVLVWLPAGPVRIANLDESQFEIVSSSGSAGATAVLRLKNGPQTLPREKAVRLTFAGGPITLPDTPLAGTVVKLWRNGLLQDPAGSGDYQMSGNVITPASAAQWSAADVIVAMYFH